MYSVWPVRHTRAKCSHQTPGHPPVRSCMHMYTFVLSLFCKAPYKTPSGYSATRQVDDPTSHSESASTLLTSAPKAARLAYSTTSWLGHVHVSRYQTCTHRWGAAHTIHSTMQSVRYGPATTTACNIILLAHISTLHSWYSSVYTGRNTLGELADADASQKHPVVRSTAYGTTNPHTPSSHHANTSPNTPAASAPMLLASNTPTH